MKKILTGTVVSNKMKNTVVVKVESIVVHPKYKRRYKRHERYSVHAKEGELNIGDRVQIEECRPISKTKRWRFVKKVEKAELKPKEETATV